MTHHRANGRMHQRGIGPMPRLHVVGAAFVIAFAANHRSHQRHLIHHLGSLRQAGGNLDALGRRTDGLCAAGNFLAGMRVKGFQLARSAAHPKHDNGFG